MFFSGLFQRKSDAPVTTPAELADAIGLSYDTYTGKQISSQRAMRLTAVFSCVRVLAESVGMLPCNLYHLNGSLKQRATGERLHKLISTHPNSYMTPQEFWELVVTCLCLRGNFYAYKVKAFGEVAELLPVDPGCVVTEMNDTSGRWSYARQLYGHVYTAKIGTLSELVTAGDQFNQQHITLAGYEKETQTPA
ncbi:TPA: phage portal protein, partial [Escherichia coli]